MPLDRKQYRRVYGPRWTAAFRANWTIGERGIEWLPRHAVAPPTLAAQCLAIAGTLAAAQHRGVRVDDIRHGAHQVALGKPVSARTLDNPQLDKVLAIFDRLINPDSLRAAMEEDGHAGKMRKVRWALANLYLPPYLRSECERIYGTTQWDTLTDDQQIRLRTHMRNRANALRPQFRNHPKYR